MRIRTIKPEFFTHERLFDAERESNLPLRLAFAGLWCAADRDGRFRWEPRRLCAAIMPYDGIDFSRVLHALSTRGFVVRYRVADAWYGAIPSWGRHQIVNNRERASDIPDVSAAEEVDNACPTRAPRVDDACPTLLNLAQEEGKGRERKGKEHILRPAAKAAVRERDVLFDALAIAEGSDPKQLTKSAGSRIGAALAQIKAVAPDLQPSDIQARTRAYKRLFPNAACTANALAAHWAKLDGFSGAQQRDEDTEPEGWRAYWREQYPPEDFPDAPRYDEGEWSAVRTDHKKNIRDGMRKRGMR